MSSFSFRIVSLPRELQTVPEVTWYVEEVVRYGAVQSVDIINNVAANGARFLSAIVRVDDSTVGSLSREQLTKAGKSGLVVPSYYEHTVTKLIVQFHFDNGKPMLHIKHVLVPEQLSIPPSLAECLDDEVKTDWLSIYIPVIPADIEMSNSLHSESGLKVFFENKLELGPVSRVDFVNRTLVDSNTSVRSAYVHFRSWNNNRTANHVREQIDARGEFKCDGYYEDRQFKRFSNPRRFMVFKMNKCPIPEANPDANIHQLAARNAHLEALVAELEAKLSVFESAQGSLATEPEDKGEMTVAELEC
jgi:hypothetical protein